MLPLSPLSRFALSLAVIYPTDQSYSLPWDSVVTTVLAQRRHDGQASFPKWKILWQKRERESGIKNGKEFGEAGGTSPWRCL